MIPDATSKHVAASVEASINELLHEGSKPWLTQEEREQLEEAKRVAQEIQQR